MDRFTKEKQQQQQLMMETLQQLLRQQEKPKTTIVDLTDNLRSEGLTIQHLKKTSRAEI